MGVNDTIARLICRCGATDVAKSVTHLFSAGWRIKGGRPMCSECWEGHQEEQKVKLRRQKPSKAMR